MNQLTTQLVHFAKLRFANPTVNVEPVNLIQIALACVANLGHLLRAHAVEIEPPTRLGLADPVAIARILDNLLVNAAKYSPKVRPSQLASSSRTAQRTKTHT